MKPILIHLTGIFANVPEWLKVLTGSGIVSGSLTAIILNIIFNVIPSRKAKSASIIEKKAA